MKTMKKIRLFVVLISYSIISTISYSQLQYNVTFSTNEVNIQNISKEIIDLQTQINEIKERTYSNTNSNTINLYKGIVTNVVTNIFTTNMSGDYIATVISTNCDNRYFMDGAGLVFLFEPGIYYFTNKTINIIDNEGVGYIRIASKNHYLNNVLGPYNTQDVILVNSSSSFNLIALSYNKLKIIIIQNIRINCGNITSQAGINAYRNQILNVYNCSFYSSSPTSLIWSIVCYDNSAVNLSPIESRNYFENIHRGYLVSGGKLVAVSDWCKSGVMYYATVHRGGEFYTANTNNVTVQSWILEGGLGIGNSGLKTGGLY